MGEGAWKKYGRKPRSSHYTCYRVMAAARRRPEAHEFLRMPLVSKKQGRISPYDLIIYRPDLASHELTLGEPVPPLYNGIDGVVIINASFRGLPCAVRLQGLNGNIANPKKNPIHPEDDRDSWKWFIRGLQRGVAFKFGPTLYAVFQATTGLVPESDRTNSVNASVKSLAVGFDAVELMRGTLYDYGVLQMGELNMDDFNQFVELYTRMKTAYAGVAPKFPFDLHANNCMYKLVGGKRVWLWTDIDENPYYMRDNYDTPRQMAISLFTRLNRQDAIHTAPPRSSPKKAASPRRSALAVVPKPASPKLKRRAAGVPTSSDIARQEAKAAALLRKPAPAAVARPAIRKPVRRVSPKKSSSVKSQDSFLNKKMSDAQVVSRGKKPRSRSPIKPYSPMMDAKVLSKKSSRKIKPYSPLLKANSRTAMWDAYLAGGK
jgi:hypothetical protein